MDPVIRLEEAIAHQAAQIEDLSAVVHRQQAELDRLTRLVGLLVDRAAEQGNDGGALVLTDQKPPHY